MTDDLVAFLRARLDSDEQLARLVEIGLGESPLRGLHPLRVEAEGGVPLAYVAYVAAHPARVLAEVDAKRRIVDGCAEVAEMDTEDAEPEFAYGRAAGLGEAVRLLALPYADHPDYREEWRPE